MLFGRKPIAHRPIHFIGLYQPDTTNCDRETYHYAKGYLPNCFGKKARNNDHCSNDANHYTVKLVVDFFFFYLGHNG